jgi:subtilisin family serine protease
MRMRFRVALIITALLALAACQTAFAERGANRFIVILKPGANVGAVVAAHARGISVTDTYQGIVTGFAGKLTPSTRDALDRDPRVLFVSDDRAVQTDAQTTPTGVSRIGATPQSPVAGVPSTAGAGVGVAVIDTGIDLDHPDLTGTQKGLNCITRTRPVDDDNGHGTHVAGTIAARDNGIGVVGVAPAATLYAVKALDANGQGQWSSVICGLIWAANQPRGLIKAVNMSLEGPGTATPSRPDCTNASNDALHYAVCRAYQAGLTLVASAGNSSTDAANTVPAAYDEVIAVSAIADSDGAPGGLGRKPSCLNGQRDDHFATFSNYGAVVDIAAPGVCILSTYLGGGYATLNGTSMAAPHVTGAAVRYIQTNPAATPAEVKAALLATEEPGPIPGDPDPYKEGVVHVVGTPAIVAGATTAAPLLPELPLPPLPVPALPVPALPELPTLPVSPP